MSVAKVTPLLGLSWEPLLLPPREFLLMIPEKATNPPEYNVVTYTL